MGVPPWIRNRGSLTTHCAPMTHHSGVAAREAISGLYETRFYDVIGVGAILHFLFLDFVGLWMVRVKGGPQKDVKISNQEIFESTLYMKSVNMLLSLGCIFTLNQCKYGVNFIEIIQKSFFFISYAFLTYFINLITQTCINLRNGFWIFIFFLHS